MAIALMPIEMVSPGPRENWLVTGMESNSPGRAHTIRGEVDWNDQEEISTATEHGRHVIPRPTWIDLDYKGGQWDYVDDWMM